MLPFVGSLKKWLIGVFLGVIAFTLLILRVDKNARKQERNEIKTEGLEHETSVYQNAEEARARYRSSKPDSSEFLRERGLLRD